MVLAQGRSVLSGLMVFMIVLSPVLAEHYVMEIGSKSNPNAHLFSYDQKFRESTNLKNYPMKMSASKEFTVTGHTKMSVRRKCSGCGARYSVAKPRKQRAGVR